MTLPTDTTPVLNRPLVEAIITKLIDHPEQHNQDSFGSKTVCGTTHCVAGWAVVLTPGVEVTWVDGTLHDAVDIDDEVAFIDEAAADLMGISAEQAESLFYDYSPTEHIIGRLKDLLNEAPSVVGS